MSNLCPSECFSVNILNCQTFGYLRKRSARGVCVRGCIDLDERRELRKTSSWRPTNNHQIVVLIWIKLCKSYPLLRFINNYNSPFLFVFIIKKMFLVKNQAFSSSLLLRSCSLNVRPCDRCSETKENSNTARI